jgi:hypothetical protein
MRLASGVVLGREDCTSAPDDGLELACRLLRLVGKALERRDRTAHLLERGRRWLEAVRRSQRTTARS